MQTISKPYVGWFPHKVWTLFLYGAKHCTVCLSISTSPTQQQWLSQWHELGGVAICLFNQWQMRECLWNQFENKNLNFKQYNTKTLYPIGLFSSLLANLTPIQYPFLSLFLWLFFLSLLFHLFLIHHLFCLPSVSFILSPALFILNAAWQSILKSQEGCSFPFARWGEPLVCQLKEWHKCSLQLSIPLPT